MVTSERPGVYTSYSVSGVLSSGRTNRGTVGVVAIASTGTKGEIYDITSYTEAVSVFGEDCNLTKLLRILILNGVITVKAIPVALSAEGTPDTAAYTEAFATMAGIDEIKILICDSSAADVHAAMRDSILSADERYAYRIGVVEGNGSVSELITAAQAVNCERMILTAPGALDMAGDAAVCGSTAAAVAGAILSESDPAIPLNGVTLYGLGGLNAAYNDGEITLLVRGGVMPLENSGGTISIIRGITTKTTTDGAPDDTWRELNTILIVDDVIPTVRDALKRMFTRAKNTVQTRGAIRTQVIVELEKKLAAEIIDGYDNVAVVQNASDPTVCDVSFAFTVTHGLNQIQLVAHITV
jgi:hypothetical protein